MFDTGRWFYVVFMCQQAVEKCCKGFYNYIIGDDVPKIHHIRQIYMCFEAKLPKKIKSEYLNLFDDLSAYYLLNRYPDFQSNREQVNKNTAENILIKTKEVFIWLMELKESLK